MSLAEIFSRWILKAPKKYYMSVVAVMLLSSIAILSLPFDDDITKLFAQGGKVEEELQNFEDQFDPVLTTMAIIVRTPRGLGEEEIQAVNEFTKKATQLKGVAEVQSITNAKVPFQSADTLEIGTLFGESSQFKGDRVERINSLRSLNPVGSTLISEDAQYTAVYVRPEPDLKSNADLRPLAANLEKTAAGVFKANDRNIEYITAGIPFHRLANVSVMEKDLLGLTPVSAVGVFLLLFLFFRDLRTTFSMLLPVVVSNGFLLSAMSLLGFQLNPLTAMLPALMAVMALADGLHILNQYQCSGLEPEDAIIFSINETIGACALTTITTIIGFGSLIFTSVPILRDFGFLAALGMGISFFVVVFLLPAGFIIFKVPMRQKSKASRKIDAWSRFITSGTRPLVIGVISIMLLAFSLYGSSRVRLDQWLADTLPSSHPVSIGNEIIEHKLGGLMPLEISLKGRPEDMLRPDVLSRMAQLEKYAVDLEKASVSVSLTSCLKRAYQAIAADGSNIDFKDQAQIDQTMLLVDNRMLEATVSDDFSHARIILRTKDRGSTNFENVRNKINKKAAVIFRNTGVRVSVAGGIVTAASGLGNLGRELLMGLIVSLLLITLTITLAFRSLNLALISLVPNLIPIVSICAFFSMLGRHLEPVGAISFTVALGIAVDDTIHLLHRFAVENRKLGDSRLAARSSVSGSFRPVLITTLTLGFGFGSLAFSQFPPNRTFGLLVASGLIIALVADLMITPALLCFAKLPVGDSKLETKDLNMYSRGEV